MSTKHSPGPWRYCHEDTGGCICGQVWSVAQDFNVAIAIYKDEEIGEIPIEQMKANAKLIACAPEMLEALQTVIEEDWLGDTPLANHINRLIQKATT